ncbi:hypothetical protein [Algibacillus agarilyticus]|uniref:hypothetical protein n=1 Tax=Algibacillus agarilyticus TaxID=2234133 RepID=UPI000DCFD3F5|nr:hypothetical protein [Algibacillus agarilyticus]
MQAKLKPIQSELNVNSHVKQGGSALVLALFIIVVMSVLASSLVKMLSATNESVAVEVYGTRALLAATTGVDYMLAQLFPIDASATDTASVNTLACADITSPYSFTLPTSTNLGMANCSFTASCFDLVVDVNASATVENVRYYRVESIGTCDVGEWQTSRKIEVEAKALTYE